MTAATYADMLAAALPRRAPKGNGLKLASLFCGAGGVDLGFRSAGWELVYANDYNDRAAATFEHNLGHRPIVGDVRDVKGEHVGSMDVLTGGFPCVTFSTAGGRAGVTDDIHGKLYLEMCRVITEAQPRVFVAENVRGILSANGGAAVKLILAAFLRMGYRTQLELVNMAEHGVPQTRERVIFVGVRADEWRGAFRYPSQTHRLRKESRRERGCLQPARSILEAIGDLPPPTMDEENNYGPRNLNAAMRHAAGPAPAPTILSGGHVPESDAPFIRSHMRNEAPIVPTFATSARTAPAPAMVAHGGNAVPFVMMPGDSATKRINGTGVSGYHNAQPRSMHDQSHLMVSTMPGVLAQQNEWRRMTVRECARVQSFPDWFEFPGTPEDGYRQVGNAVPPLYAKRLAQAIESYLRRPL